MVSCMSVAVLLEEDGRAIQREIQHLHLLLVRREALRGRGHGRRTLLGGILLVVTVVLRRPFLCKEAEPPPLSFSLLLSGSDLLLLLLYYLLLGRVLLLHPLEEMQRAEVVVLLQHREDVRNAHREAIVGERGIDVAAAVALVHCILANQARLHLLKQQRRDDHVEVLQLRVLAREKHLLEHVDEHLEVVRPLRKVLRQRADDLIQVPSCPCRLLASIGSAPLSVLRFGAGLRCRRLKPLRFLQVGDKLDGFSTVVHRCTAHHADVSQRIADLAHELAELIQEGHAALAEPELPNLLDHAERTGIRVDVVDLRRVLVLLEPATLPRQTRLDVVIDEELGEHAKLLRQELIREVDRRVQNAQPVLPKARCDALRVDGVEMPTTSFRNSLNENLLVHVVCESVGEDVDIPHNLQHVNPRV
mmetsp:Transcript_10575/g.39862  ORF Transcript_10575/g.39862 Transcript_10575/m.39862 type:complete len:418 (+) Transcript_10575:27-1280(+)